MEWHINDLSLRGQFTDTHAFRASLEPILRLRQRRADLKTRILCSRSLHLRPVTRSSDLRQAILATRDPLFVRLALEWFANAGPFWNDDRAVNPDDYFHFEGQDVTDQGLGEAARRNILKIAAHCFSFSDPPVNYFHRTPLSVHHGLPEDPLGTWDVTNVWTVQDVEKAAFVPPLSWAELLVAAKETLNLLLVSADVVKQLRPSPFHGGVASRILELLKILQGMAAETRDDGSLTDAGLELLQMHFVGAKASFTDESTDNKRMFENEMTFPDPSNPSAFLFCTWHGRVKIGQFRIHFEWPRPKGQRQIKVVYIGPKITKR
jgi:hypothetical protein